MIGILILIYIDDFAEFSRTFAKHLENLRQVFMKIREFGLRINREKCHFCCSSIKFLGHVITRDGLLPDPSKTKAISEMTAPRCVKQLLSFLAACSWFRRFVPNFAQTAEPLMRLTWKAST